MAPVILQAKSYLLLLLHEHTTYSQAKCLLGTANKTQLSAIAEIFRNISSLSTKDKPKLKRTLKRNSVLIHLLSKNTVSPTRRLNAIRQHLQVVLRLIHLVKEEIILTLS